VATLLAVLLVAVELAILVHVGTTTAAVRALRRW
jgi:hypothetical protein